MSLPNITHEHSIETTRKADCTGLRRGVTLFQKVGVPIFGVLEGVGRGWGCAPSQKIFHNLLSKRRILVDT